MSTTIIAVAVAIRGRSVDPLHPNPSLLHLHFFFFPDVCRLHSVQLLSFVASHCWLLLNGDWLLQLQWRQAEDELQTTASSSSCWCRHLQLSDGAGELPAVDHVLCAETLFVMHANGLICILMIYSQPKHKNSLSLLLPKHPELKTSKL